jgi:hypothetical protein
VPLVVTVHDAATVLFPETYPRAAAFSRIGIRGRGRADAIVAPTAAAADEVAEHTDRATASIRSITASTTTWRPTTVRAARRCTGLLMIPT